MIMSFRLSKTRNFVQFLSTHRLCPLAYALWPMPFGLCKCGKLEVSNYWRLIQLPGPVKYQGLQLCYRQPLWGVCNSRSNLVLWNGENYIKLLFSERPIMLPMTAIVTCLFQIFRLKSNSFLHSLPAPFTLKLHEPNVRINENISAIRSCLLLTGWTLNETRPIILFNNPLFHWIKNQL